MSELPAGIKIKDWSVSVERDETYGWFLYSREYEAFPYLLETGEWHDCCPEFFPTPEAAVEFAASVADLPPGSRLEKSKYDGQWLVYREGERVLGPYPTALAAYAAAWAAAKQERQAISAITPSADDLASCSEPPPASEGQGALTESDIDYILTWIVQVDGCEGIRHKIPKNIRGLARRAYATRFKPAPAQPAEPPPAYVYWNAEHCNFYNADTHLGMGTEFYTKWKSRCGEFRTVAQPAEPMASVGDDPLLDDPLTREIYQCVKLSDPATAAACAAIARAWFENRPLLVSDFINTHDPAESAADHLLSDLLAVIHRDGGHYEDQHGTAKAVEDAMAIASSFVTGEPAEPMEAAGCQCEACLKLLPPDGYPVPHHRRRMVVCGYCGNKRCPHAHDHRYACTGSNEPGQTPQPAPGERELPDEPGHHLFHSLWTKAVGTPGYDKAAWRELDRLITNWRKARPADDERELPDCNDVWRWTGDGEDRLYLVHSGGFHARLLYDDGSIGISIPVENIGRGHWRKARPADERLREALQKIANGEYDNAHDCKAAAKIARAALAAAGGGK